MDDLVTWLHEKLDEDESVARRVSERSKRPRAGESLLVEIDSMRRIADLHAEPHECPAWEMAAAETYTGWFGGSDPCPTLRLLALRYSERKGYQEWKP